MIPLLRLARVDSTQSFLERHPEFVRQAVLAGEQTQGRGRLGNAWESAQGAGLWLSAALPAPAVDPGLLPQRAMGAVAEALEEWGAQLGLKWPNDLVARSGGRLVKVGGLIGQMKGRRLLLGLGVNLIAAPRIPHRPIPPASLADLGLERVPGPLELARAILGLWEDLETHREPAFRWPEAGDPIRWEEGRGLCRGWLADGRLEVETDRGLERLSAGDVCGLGQGG
jgi:BirA family biotin operon repressor/biotin-[acetyl-CoA-carboxylase] ligase